MSNILTVKIVPDLEISKMNYVRVSAFDYPSNCYILIDNRYVFTTQICTKINPGTVGLTYTQRKWGLWSTNQKVIVSLFDSTLKNDKFNIGYLSLIDLEIKLVFNNFNTKNMSNKNNQKYNYNKIKKKFIEEFQSQIIQPAQILLLKYKNKVFELVVHSTLVLNLETVSFKDVQLSSSLMNKGIVVNTTIINFLQKENKLISLEKTFNRKNIKHSIIRPDVKFCNRKGLLDNYLTNTLRIALASRFFPNNIIEKMNLTHTKGILIYGVSKFSKCLLSKKIGKKLHTKEIKIYNSSKVLSRYFETNGEFLNEIFKNAELEFERKGEKSLLHIIVFDELDEILKNSKIRNIISKIFIRELLNKLERDNSLNNILIIGMLNDKKLVNSDLVKPGRFDVQIENEKCKI